METLLRSLSVTRRKHVQFRIRPETEQRLLAILDVWQKEPELADESINSVARVALETPGGLEALEAKWMKKRSKR